MATYSLAASQNLASSSLSATTAFTTDTNNYLAYISLHFSAAPTSVETIKVYLTSRNGSNYDMLLATVTTTASTTTDVAIVAASTIPVNTTDQIKVTCTNVTGSGTVYLSIVVDEVQRSGPGLFIYKDGVLTATSGALPVDFLQTYTSAQLAGKITDETGTGALVFATTPTLVTPVLGAATFTTLTSGNTANAIDLSAIAAGTSNIKITATSDTPSTVWTAGVPDKNPVGYIEITVGASTRYLPFWD